MALSARMLGALNVSRAEILPPAIRRHLRVVVDVGANQGEWLGSLMKVVPVRNIVAFEPNPGAGAVLRERFVGHTKVTIRELALGAEPGLLPLNITTASEFASFLTPLSSIDEHYAARTGTVTEQMNVNVSTLDAEMSDVAAIDLLKIDVQGFERQVLKGAAATLTRTRALLIEVNFISHYAGDDTFTTLPALITGEYGFTYWNMSEPYRDLEGRGLWADMVFVNPSCAV